MYFDVRFTVRLTQEQLKIINEIVNVQDELYGSKGHFVRCAVVKLIREHKKNAN